MDAPAACAAPVPQFDHLRKWREPQATVTPATKSTPMMTSGIYAAQRFFRAGL